jgi:uncharacterized DUF497 family protein
LISDRFEWDDDKAGANLEKHGISFEVAVGVFDDPLSVTIRDPVSSEGELRFLTIGTARSGALLVAAHVDRGERIRIINARRATRNERRIHMDEDYDRIHDEMLPEYDFSGGERGKYYRGRTTVMVRLEEDVAKQFPTSREVNGALRQLIAEGRVPPSSRD